MSDAVLIALFVMLSGVVLGCYGYAWRVSTAATDAIAAAKAEAAEAVAEALAKSEKGLKESREHAAAEIQRVEQNLYDYKQHVAMTFSSAKHLELSEQRTQAALADIKTSLRDIDAKLDRRSAE